MKNKFLMTCIFLILFLISCSQIKVINQQEIYSQNFINRIAEIKKQLASDKPFTAMNQLKLMKDDELSADEKATKYNLIGFYHFKKNEYQISYEYFKRALSFVNKDEILRSQIYLNAASAMYQSHSFEQSHLYLKNIQAEILTSAEQKKFYYLNYLVSRQLADFFGATRSLIGLMSEEKTFTEVRGHKNFTIVLDMFEKISDEQRAELFDIYSKKPPLILALLAKREVERRYFSGDKRGAYNRLSWLEYQFNSETEVNSFIKNFEKRVENFNKVKVENIGVVLPLSGDKSTYALRALKGIQFALGQVGEKDQSGATRKQFKLILKDSKANKFIGEQAVKDLVEKDSVGIIIGGLYSEEATPQYQEARKYGVPFISLAPIYLPRDQKNHLLIELQGSVQSIVAQLISDDFLNKMGRNIAVLYPDSERGSAFVDELWQLKDHKDFRIVSINSFPKNINDYRDSVSKLLAIKFKRERQEELDIWSKIYEAEGKTSVRRIQILKPVLDFDWVFLPAFPYEVKKIIPTFKYYDAKNILYVGGPSWKSKSLISQQSQLGSLFLISDQGNQDFIEYEKKYRTINKKSPSLVEAMGSEAFVIINQVFGTQDIEDREQINRRLINLGTIKGISGSWVFTDGQWIKKLDGLKISRGHLEKLF